MDAYIVKLYSKCTKTWLQLTKAIPLEEAEDFLKQVTLNGTKHTSPKEGDYYKIFKIGANNLTIKRYRK